MRALKCSVLALRIQSDCGKIRTRNNSEFGHFSHSAQGSHFFNFKVNNKIKS